MTKICCVCQRVEDGPHWREEYQFAPGERITHGYCPLCFDVVMADLTEYVENRHRLDSRLPVAGREDLATCD